jgi:aspartate/tyrosine/aromatic aminotransferase
MRINQLYNKCNNPNKINLVIGAYRNKEGLPYIFQSVKKAKKYISANSNHEYLPITGDNEYVELSKKLYFGDKTNLSGVQTLSGTGSLYLASKLLEQIVDPNKTIYLPNPTWDNHRAIFQTSGLGLSSYEHILPNRKWDFNFLYQQVKKIPDSNIILFHGCAHNPTGYDPCHYQWADLIELCVKKNMLIIVDMAYLGFGSGDTTQDSGILRIINNQDYPVLVCSSYAKNFGLYSERVGNLFFRGYNKEDSESINDILRTIIRKIYSNPPSNGSNIVKTILSNGELYNLWKEDLVDIGTHYQSIRANLKNQLENKVNNDFTNIIRQKGMFWYSDLGIEQVEYLRTRGIFMPDNGRISLAGLSDSNMDKFVAEYVNAIKI